MIIKTDQDIIRSYFEDSSNLKGGYAREVAIPATVSRLVGLVRSSAPLMVWVNVLVILLWKRS